MHATLEHERYLQLAQGRHVGSGAGDGQVHKPDGHSRTLLETLNPLREGILTDADMHILADPGVPEKIVTVQVVQVRLRWEGLLQPRCAEEGVRVQAYPCTLPGMRQPYTLGQVDAVV